MRWRVRRLTVAGAAAPPVGTRWRRGSTTGRRRNSAVPWAGTHWRRGSTTGRRRNQVVELSLRQARPLSHTSWAPTPRPRRTPCEERTYPSRPPWKCSASRSGGRSPTNYPLRRCRNHESAQSPARSPTARHCGSWLFTQRQSRRSLRSVVVGSAASGRSLSETERSPRDEFDIL